MEARLSISLGHEYSECSRNSWPERITKGTVEVIQDGKHMLLTSQPLICESSKDLENSPPEGAVTGFNTSQFTKDCLKEKCKAVENLQKSLDQQWCDISEVIESNFLISPGDIYSNRKVQLEDADTKNTTKAAIELLCEKQCEAFSKNNKDIGHAQLIEMEIDMGDSLPVAQSPYTLLLKHYDWVRQEIKTLKKSGVIERSLSRWASPVIIGLKKSAPDEPPRRRLCVNYRKVNTLQQEFKCTNRSTGCLSLYPLPKMDEMLSKLGGATMFSTIHLCSGYFHIGLTRESRAKSAFVVPMGKWQFKCTPFRISPAPAPGCSSFAMGYLDDIIIFSKT